MAKGKLHAPLGAPDIVPGTRVARCGNKNGTANKRPANAENNKAANGEVNLVAFRFLISKYTDLLNGKKDTSSTMKVIHLNEVLAQSICREVTHEAVEAELIK